MGYYVASQQFQGYDPNVSTLQIVKYHFELDNETDLPTQNKFSSDNVKIAMTSTAHVINGDTSWEMQSDGTWKKQKSNSIILDASNIEYDNTTSGMTADNVQDAIDELKDENDTQDRALVELYAEDANQQVEINYAINTGCKNYCPYNDLTATSSGTLVNKGAINLPSGTYKLTYHVTATSGSVAVRLLKNDSSLWNETISNGSGGNIQTTITIADDANQITFYSSVANVITNIMIRSSDVRNATFKPYAPTNRELYEMILALQSSLGLRSLNTPQLRQFDETTELDITPDFQESEIDDESR